MTQQRVVEPVQEWLLAQGRCTGCGESLEEAEKQECQGFWMVICQCERVFIYDARTGVYRRRALRGVSSWRGAY